MVQGGYVSQSQGKQLTINKKANVLDKNPKSSKSNILNATTIASNASNNNESSGSGSEQIIGASVCIFIYYL